MEIVRGGLAGLVKKWPRRLDAYQVRAIHSERDEVVGVSRSRETVQFPLDIAVRVDEGQKCMTPMSDRQIAHFDVPVVWLFRRQLIDVFLCHVRQFVVGVVIERFRRRIGLGIHENLLLLYTH